MVLFDCCSFGMQTFSFLFFYRHNFQCAQDDSSGGGGVEVEEGECKSAGRIQGEV